MEVLMSEEQRMITGAVRRFVREEVQPLERDLDPDAVELPPGELDRLKGIVQQMGLYHIDVPEDYGGPGLELTTRGLVAEEMSQHRAGLYLPCYGAFGSAGLAQLYAASDDQQDRYLYPMLNGEKRAFFGLTEPSGGSDPARAIQTKAVKDGDDWNPQRESNLSARAPDVSVEPTVPTLACLRAYRSSQGPTRHLRLPRRYRLPRLRGPPRRAYAALCELWDRAVVR